MLAVAASEIPAWIIVCGCLSVALFGLMALYFCTRGISPHPRTSQKSPDAADTARGTTHGGNP